MKRWSLVVIVAALVVPATVSGQRQTMQTRSAAVYMKSANETGDQEKRTSELQKALNVLMQGAERDAGNALIWKMAGQAYARLGDVAGADSAFTKAETLHPDYAEEIEPERNALWINEYNKGIAAIQTGDALGAIDFFEAAGTIYEGRPDAVVTLGPLYTQAGNLEKAEAAYKKAIEITRGPASANVLEGARAQWLEHDELAATRLADLQSQLGRGEESLATYRALVEYQPDNPRALSGLAAQLARTGNVDESAALYEQLLSRDDLSDIEWFNAGVGLYSANNYPMAVKAFDKSLEVNPYARDAMYNLGQALYGAASDIEKQRDEAPEAEQAAFVEKLTPLYEMLAETATNLREIDPFQRNPIMMLAQAQSSFAELAGDEAAEQEWREKVLATLQAADEMTFEVSPIEMLWVVGGVTVTGDVTNLKATAGDEIVLEFTLVGEGGSTLATEVVRLTTPAVDARTSFEFEVSTDETVLGWRYKVTS